jgi:hypothetical protein
MKIVWLILLLYICSAGLTFADKKPILDEWKSEVDVNGVRKAKVIGHGMTPDGMYQTMLTLQCKPGKDGLISFVYLISGANEIQGFTWKDFEGPDAPASKNKLGRIKVLAPTGTITFQKELTGYFANPEAFAFEFSVPANQKSDVTQAIEKIINGAGTISYCVQDNRYPMKSICTDFSARKASKPVEETMRPCL